jgi:methionyl-tRNA synthetase
MSPFMPTKAQKLWSMLGQPGDVRTQPWPGIPTASTFRQLPAGQRLGTVEGLFPKLDDKQIAAELETLERRKLTPT